MEDVWRHALEPEGRKVSAPASNVNLPSLHPSCCPGQFCCRCAALALPPYSLAQTAVYSEQKHVKQQKKTKRSISTAALIPEMKLFQTVTARDGKFHWTLNSSTGEQAQPSLSEGRNTSSQKRLQLGQHHTIPLCSSLSATPINSQLCSRPFQTQIILSIRTWGRFRLLCEQQFDYSPNGNLGFPGLILIRNIEMSLMINGHSPFPTASRNFQCAAGHDGHLGNAGET